MITHDSSIKTKADMRDLCLDTISDFPFLDGNSIDCSIYGKGFYSSTFDKRPITSAKILISFLEEVADEIKNFFLNGKYVTEAFSLSILRKINGKFCIETCYIDTDYYIAFYYNNIINPNNRVVISSSGVVNNLGKTRVEYKNQSSISEIFYPILKVFKMNYEEIFY